MCELTMDISGKQVDSGEMVGIQLVATRSMRQMMITACVSQSVNVHVVMGMEIDVCVE